MWSSRLRYMFGKDRDYQNWLRLSRAQRTTRPNKAKLDAVTNHRGEGIRELLHRCWSLPDCLASRAVPTGQRHSRAGPLQESRGLPHDLLELRRDVVYDTMDPVFADSLGREKHNGCLRLSYERPQEPRGDCRRGPPHEESEASSKPWWLTIPKHGLYIGIAVVGAIGSGETSCCVFSFAEQILRN
jgi:hypothetical protein